DLAGLALQPGGVPIHLTGVEHRVAAAADVDESRFHRREDVLHPAEIDVADDRAAVRRGDEMLDEHTVLEHTDLSRIATLGDHHGPLDRLPAGEELGLRQDRGTPPARFPAVPATLTPGRQTGGAAHAAHAVLGLRLLLLGGLAVPHVDDRVGRVVRRRRGLEGVVVTAPAAAPAAATPGRRGLGLRRLGGTPLGVALLLLRGRLSPASDVAVGVTRDGSRRLVGVLGARLRLLLPFGGPGGVGSFRGRRGGGVGGRGGRRRRGCGVVLAALAPAATTAAPTATTTGTVRTPPVTRMVVGLPGVASGTGSIRARLALGCRRRRGDRLGWQEKRRRCRE